MGVDELTPPRNVLSSMPNRVPPCSHTEDPMQGLPPVPEAFPLPRLSPTPAKGVSF